MPAINAAGRTGGHERKTGGWQRLPIAGAATAAEAKANEKLENLLTLDTLQIELGYGLIPMADKAKGRRFAGTRHRRAPDISRRTWAC